MLVVMRVDIRRDGRTEVIGLAVGLDIDLHDSGQADLDLDVAVLVEEVVEEVFYNTPVLASLGHF